MSQISATPSENDIRNIKLLISECEANISNVDGEIHTLQEKRNKWITQLHAFNTALCHATRLPPETVAEIFLQIRSSQKLRGMPYESIFVSICSRWRNIAVSTQALWSEMELDLCAREPRFSKQMALLRTWCERAGARPLSITLRLMGLNVPREVNPIVTLLPHMANISTLRLRLPSAHFLVLFALPADSFPSLEVFDAQTDFKLGNGNLRSITTFKAAYRLRSVQFLSLCRHVVLHPPPQLSELVLRLSLCIRDCLDVLCDCPGVETLELVLDWGTIDVVANRSVLLPSLRKLTLRIPEYSICGALFDLITLPALMELKLMCADARDSWSHLSFQSLISRSSWNLERLTIHYAHMSHQQFYECYRSLPSLTELNFDGAGFVDDRILAALTYNADAFVRLLPKLQKFRLDVFDDFEAESQAFVDMVESRWWADTRGPARGICRLEEVRLASEDDLVLSESQLRRLSRCRRQGLVIDCCKL